MAKKVLIITETGTNIGLGHLSRCFGLYEALEAVGAVPEIILKLDGAFEISFEDKNIKVLDWWEENNINRIDNSGYGAVVLDSYNATPGIYEYMMGADFPVFFDDMGSRYEKGTVINGAVKAETLDYPQRGNVSYLLGTKYLCLRKVFWDIADKKNKKDVGNILVALGGGDPRGITRIVLEAISENFPTISKNIVLGKGSAGYDVEKYVTGKDKVFQSLSGTAMKRLEENADICICGMGQTLYECACVGTGAISIAMSDNQRYDVDRWRDVGFMEYAGMWSDGDLTEKLIG
ncbi:MAG TPA: hypothetical protein PKG81_07690, partial [Candidatus Omnitrophota bacterium]|nr:hypothetical protein [Candidatus Omnitrophota bacterium]